MKPITHVFFTALFVLGGIKQATAFKGDLSSVAKRPGTNELFVAGEFKTLFVINTKNGLTKRTLALPDGAQKIEFTEDGNILLAAGGGSVKFLNPVDGTVITSIRGSNFFLFERSKYLVDVGWSGKEVKMYSTADGSRLFSIACEFEVSFASISKDQKKLYVFGKSETMNEEASLLTAKIQPASEYNLYNETYIDQQADGKGVKYCEVDIETQKVSTPVQLAWSPEAGSYSNTESVYKGNLYLLGWKTFFKIDATGKVTPIETSKACYAYAAGSTSNGRYIIVSDTKGGYIYDAENGNVNTFNLKTGDDMVYTADVSTLGDTVYVLGKDYTIAVMNTRGTVLKNIKIERATGSIEFGLFYINGFNKKEDRDKEAAIINNGLKKIAQPEIDLEQYIGKSDVLIAKFASEGKAKAFLDELNNNGLQYLVKITPVDK
ncbi:MAG TPA: hypothetical protein VD905_04005 [Flavobacteriales bacterium]|nr:hypothetical protein [Flavobacteriales bacterium]